MGRPRKNRLGEYAQAMGEELQRLISDDVQRLLAEQQASYEQELAAVRKELSALTRQVEQLTKKSKVPKPKVGKWVPGGPGRPPKDASERIAAFERTRRTKKR